MITLHEFGHYLFARIFKVAITEFSIGMGPKLFSRVSKKTEIRYSVRLLPIGGYVAMVGEDEESENVNALCNKPVWQRIIVTFAGSFFNLLSGIILVLLVVVNMSALPTNQIDMFTENAVSSEYGLMEGDKITAINGESTPTGRNVAYEIGHSGVEPVDVTVIRNGEEKVISGVNFGQMTEDGVAFGLMDFYVEPEAKSFGNVVRHTFYNSVLTVKMIWESLIDLVTGKYGMEAVSGPVGVTTAIGDAAKQGAGSLLYICAVIAVNLGIFNLLPLPALDGGRIFFMLIELVRGKPVSRKYEGLVHFAGIVILLTFMLIITFKDILGLF